MLTTTRLTVALLIVFCLGGPALAQTAADVHAPPTVTATATDKGVRFAAAGDVVEMRLEVFSPAGEKIFETEFRRGNLLDWATPDSQQPFSSSDAHLCVVTVRTLAGHLSQRHGLVSWQSGQAAVRRIERDQLSAAQSQAWELSRTAQALPPLAEDADAASLNVLPAEAPPSVTVTAHDGENGQVTSTAGALTFRTGDLFAGKDVERVRITEDGKVGIGTEKPEATLDVAGAVRVSEGVKFSDGTTLDAAGGKLTLRDAAGDMLPGSSAAAVGTGTQNRLAKWAETGGAGTLTDAAGTEASGLIFFGQNASGQVAPLFPTAANNHVLEVGATGSKSPLTLAGGSGVMEFWKDLGGGTGAPAAAVSFGMAKPGTASTNDVVFSTYLSGQPWNERMRITNAGNVGVGTNDPQAKLHVAGNGLFTGDLTVNGSVSLPANSITDAMVSNTLTASNLVAGSSVVSNAEVADDLTINGGTIDNTVIGATTPAAGTFTTLAAGSVTFTGLRTYPGPGGAPSVIGGQSTNNSTALLGATIAGGAGNSVKDNYGAVGGGTGNQAGDDVAGSISATHATVGGGQDNTASGLYSTVPGGFSNTAQGELSFAAGRQAKALHNGTFVWADSTASGDFASTNINQFLIRAQNVGINTNDPKATLGLEGTTGNANFFMRNAGETLGVNFGVGAPPAGQNAPLFIAQYDGTTYLNRLIVNTDGTVSVPTLAADTMTHLCLNGTKLASCSSSLRYKERVAPFSAGLGLVKRLRPVTFKWKERDERDLGLIAEEVNQVEPLLVTRNAAGEIQGVKYDQLSVVLINAAREQQSQIDEQQELLRRQQSQIEQQQSQLKQQQGQIESLRKLVCRAHPSADACR